MAVTELALLRLLPGTTIASPRLLHSLRSAKAAMEAFTSFPFRLYGQHEDPSCIYILGSWATPAQHWAEWIPSPENQELLELVKNQLTVEWMFHVDVRQDQLPVDAPVVAIERHFCAGRSGREGLERWLREKRGALEESTKPRKLGGGWRVEKDGEDREEFVLFSGWDGVEHHDRFAQSDVSGEYAKIRGVVQGFEVRHAVPLKL